MAPATCPEALLLYESSLDTLVLRNVAYLARLNLRGTAWHQKKANERNVREHCIFSVVTAHHVSCACPAQRSMRKGQGGKKSARGGGSEKHKSGPAAEATPKFSSDDFPPLG